MSNSDNVIKNAAEEQAVKDLRSHYRACVEKFLKTVVVFDDQAFEGLLNNAPPHQVTNSAEANVEAGELVDPITVADTFATHQPSVFDKRAPGIAVTPLKDPREKGMLTDAVPDDVSTANHSLDGPNLIRRFAAKGILCAVEQPDQNSDDAVILNQIAELANTADVIVLDWSLSKQNKTIAKSAIENIFNMDDRAKGRLRLIVIYTAESAAGIIQQLSGVSCLERIEGNQADRLKRPHALVVVMNKPGGANAGVELDALPDRIIEAYVEMTAGLLPAAAVKAVGVIRENTHHFLSQFNSSLDGAYIAHKCLIPNAEDAESYLVELYADSLRNLMIYGGAGDALSNEKCELWIRAQDKLWTTSQISCIIDALGEYSTESANKLKVGLSLKKDDFPENFMKLICSASDHNQTLNQMHCLSNFSRSSNDHIEYASAPRLQLGTVVAIPAESGAENLIFLLCVQPRCDSLRLKGIRHFPFLRLAEESNELCIQWDNRFILRSINRYPQNIEMIAFGEDDKKLAAIVATRSEDSNDQWVFATAEQPPRSLIWVGELRRDKAQKIASDLAARLHSPGFDEFEVCRNARKTASESRDK